MEEVDLETGLTGQMRRMGQTGQITSSQTRQAPLTNSRFANKIRNMIKGQDLVVLSVLMGNGADKFVYAELGKLAHISASEAHAAVRRLQESGLLNEGRRPIRRNVREFFAHGLRYSFPVRPSGKRTMGIPTSYAAPVATDVFVTTGLQPVWECPNGTVFGQAFEPIYPTAPEAARGNRGVYDRLALIDMLRGGRIRERLFAERKLEEILS